MPRPFFLFGGSEHHETWLKFDHQSLVFHQEMEVSDNPSLRKDTSDPTLICTAYKKNRFYLFTRKEPEDAKG